MLFPILLAIAIPMSLNPNSLTTPQENLMHISVMAVRLHFFSIFSAFLSYLGMRASPFWPFAHAMGKPLLESFVFLFNFSYRIHEGKGS